MKFSLGLGAYAYTCAYALVAATMISSVGVGQVSENPDDSSDVIIKYPDLHGNNRAVAFGSILLSSAGHDVGNWQALTAWDMCPPWMPIPLPDPSLPTDPDQPVPSPIPGDGSGDTGSGTAPEPGDTTWPECEYKWDVAVTTDYRLEVCPDGRAYILRSGVGILLKDRREGDSYAWEEAVFCEDDLKIASANSGMDKDRPLDRNRLIRRGL